MLHVSPSEVHFWPITQHVLPCWQHGLYCFPVRKGLAQPSHVVQSCFCRLLLLFFFFVLQGVQICMSAAGSLWCWFQGIFGGGWGSGVMLTCSISPPFDVDRGVSLPVPRFHFQTAVCGCVSVEMGKTDDFVSQRSSWWFWCGWKCCDGYLSLFGDAAMDV